MTDESLLQQMMQKFMWVDEQWLEEHSDNSCTYWQARLPQEWSVQELPDGRSKWRIQTRIVANVRKPMLAVQLCNALNPFATGWSFAYDSAERCVYAVAALCAPVEYDRFLLRLSEAAKLSAWFSDVIADRLADALGGVPAVSYPTSQRTVRDIFDATHYYLQTLRGRPEAVLDLTHMNYPDQDELGAMFASRMAGDGDELDTTNGEIAFTVRNANNSVSHHITACFAEHPVTGPGWHSAVQFPAPGVTSAMAIALNGLTWQMWEQETTTLLGAWSLEEDRITFDQWVTTSELRHYLELPTRIDGPSGWDLWGVTSTAIDAIVTRDDLEEYEGGSPGDVLDQWHDALELEPLLDLVEWVMDAIPSLAKPVLEEIPTPESEPAQRRLLWLERKRILAAAVWFNPMGPTVQTLELCSSGGSGPDYLVAYQRHPFTPDYRVLGEAPPSDLESEQWTQLLAEGAEFMLQGSIPHALTLWDAPEELVDPLFDCLAERLLDMESHLGGSDLAWEAYVSSYFKGRPWDEVSPDKLPPSGDYLDEHLPPEERLNRWWQAASDFENVSAQFTHLPDAWDGALNFQKSHGNLRWLDVGPLLVTYSSIGLVDATGEQAIPLANEEKGEA